MGVLRVVVWVLVVLLVLIGGGAVAISVRHHRAEPGLHESATLDDDDAAWLAALPDIDVETRALAWAWMTADWPTGKQGQMGYSPDREERWYLRAEAPPAELIDQHELERPHMATLHALLEKQDACLSSAAFRGWPREGMEHHPGVSRVPNLVTVGRAARWYAFEAMAATDPGPALDGLDRLVASLRPACSLIDAMVGTSLAAVRDRAYLRLIYKAALSASRVEAWLAEPCAARDRLREAIRADRLLLWAPIARDLAAGDERARRALYPDPMEPDDWLDYLWHAHADVAVVTRAYRLLEDHLGGATDVEPVSVIREWSEGGGRTARMSIPNPESLLWTVVSVRAAHRVHRLLARVLRAGPPPPPDDSALRARLGPDAATLDAGTWDVALHYERLDPGRVRFVVLEDTPLAAIFEARREDSIRGSAGRQRWGQHPPPVFHLTAFNSEMQLPR